MKTAIFIDAENTATDKLEPTINFLKQSKNIVIARIYGNFHSGNLSNLIDTIKRLDLKIINVIPYALKKNCTDLQITIDVLDTLYKKEYIDEFILVSSDSDFTSLYHYLVEANKKAIRVIDENKASEFLVNQKEDVICLKSGKKATKKKKKKSAASTTSNTDEKTIKDCIFSMIEKEKNVSKIHEKVVLKYPNYKAILNTKSLHKYLTKNGFEIVDNVITQS